MPHQKRQRQKSLISGLDPEEFLADPTKKQLYVTRLFDLVAPGYDRFTRLFSFGMDQRWKALLIRAATARADEESLVLDLACGTGDIAFALARKGHEVIGLDASHRMLEIARDRRQNDLASNLSFSAGD